MATNFKNFSASAVATGAGTTLYTCPASTTAVVTFLIATATSGANATATLSLVDSSASTTANIAKSIIIPTTTSVQFVSEGTKLILEAGDSLKADAAVANTLSIVGSVMEIS